MLPPRPQSPISPTPALNLSSTFTSTFRADAEDVVQVYEDHDSDEDAPPSRYGDEDDHDDGWGSDYGSPGVGEHLWPKHALHSEDYYGYAYDAHQNTLCELNPS